MGGRVHANKGGFMRGLEAAFGSLGVLMGSPFFAISPPSTQHLSHAITQRWHLRPPTHSHASTHDHGLKC